MLESCQYGIFVADADTNIRKQRNFDIQYISADINMVNVVIMSFWQRYEMEVGYLTFEQTWYQTSVHPTVNTSHISY